MFVCPNCTKRLSFSSTSGGPSWPCRNCGGFAFPAATLRKTEFPVHTLERVLSQAKAGEGVRGRYCPICANWMAGLPVQVENETITIDVCASCELFWFDPSEFQRVLSPPPKPAETLPVAPPPKLPPGPVTNMPPPPWSVTEPATGKPAPGAAGAVAGPGEYELEIKMRWWNYLSGFLGLPIEIQSPKRKRKPSATATLAAIIAGVSFFAYTFAPGIVTWFGFSSEYPFRFLGLTMITSFFLHSGLFHLLGNLYFLMTFGDNVEDFLGVRRFLLLLLGATVVGNLLQFTANPGSNMLVIGSSGGIAGVVAFYGLQFRQARLAIFLLRFIPVKLSAIWALLLWFAFQLGGAAMGWVNTDHTAYAAHLGGAATGLILWRVWQTR